jgi:hypothetical protein
MDEVTINSLAVSIRNVIYERDQFYPELPQGRFYCIIDYDRLVFCDGSEIKYVRKITFENGKIFINVR